MRHAATRLADEAQLRQKLEEGRIDRRPLANEHERLGIADLRGSFGDGPRAFRMDNDVVPRDGGEAPQSRDGQLVILHDDDAHEPSLIDRPREQDRAVERA